MNYKEYFNEDEKPLDTLLPDAGFCSIFRTIACIGDSLSSGEFQITDSDGNSRYYDMFEYSWGQFMARAAGSKVYNFSRGGMTAKEYLTGFAEHMGYWDRAKAAQAYILALGMNDLKPWLDKPENILPLGEADDCDNESAETFSYYYGGIIKRYKEIQPDAKFFLMTMIPYGNCNDGDKRINAHAELLYKLVEKFSNCYVLDFRKYAPMCDADYKEKFWLSGHLNPMGYCLTAKMVMSYIDYIIRHNMNDFKHVGFIGK